MIFVTFGGGKERCVERPMSRLSKRVTKKPRSASCSQNSSCQAIICVPRPMISSSDGLARSPKWSWQSVISSLTWVSCSGIGA